MSKQAVHLTCQGCIHKDVCFFKEFVKKIENEIDDAAIQLRVDYEGFPITFSLLTNCKKYETHK